MSMEVTVFVAGLGGAFCLSALVLCLWAGRRPSATTDGLKARIWAIQMKNRTSVPTEGPYADV
jgi:hypothetical protein